MWVIFAFGSAIFAGLTAILAKSGIKNMDSNVATALRTVVVLIFSWVMVFVTGCFDGVYTIGGKPLLFLGLSGLSTGASWLCYFKALQIGDVNKVTPVDKSSTILTMLLAFLFLGERLTPLKVGCMVLMAVGTWMMIRKKDTGENAQSAAVLKEQGNSGKTQVTGGGNERESSETVHLNGIAEKVRQGSWQKWAGSWFLFAAGSALFASLTSILGKVGMDGINSNLGTAIRTIVVLIMAWIVVAVTGKMHTIRKIDKTSWLFLVLSGCATGASWLCYYRALQTGQASIVVPIDKLSIVLTVVFARVVFKEKLSRKALIGLLLIVAGTLLLLV